MEDKAIAKTRSYLSSLCLKIEGNIFGSYARGDFNYAGDMDLLIISVKLLEDLNERLSF